MRLGGNDEIRQPGAPRLTVAARAAHASDERYEHYKGLPAETLQQAVANFSEYNTRLEAILAARVDDNAMHDVHELT